MRTSRRAVVGAAALLAGTVVVPPASAGALDPVDLAIYLSEIHYDNDGTDAGEAVEITGPAGTDLTGWSIVLYNGSSGEVYDTDPVSGVLTDQGGGVREGSIPRSFYAA